MIKKLQSIINKCIPLITILLLLLVWQVISNINLIPKYMLPSPIEVVRAFFEDFGLLMEHLSVTLVEAVVGLFMGVLLGFVIAVIMDNVSILHKAFYPLLVITQTIPTVAIAPLLVLWFGYGIFPKVILIVLVTFFPVTIGLLGGFASVDRDMITLLKSMGANRWQVFTHVKFPAALGEFFSGLKIAIAYSVVGAVISEWLGGFSGLGVYMTRVRKGYEYDKMFAVIFLISAISLILMWIVKIIQRKCMKWEETKM